MANCIMQDATKQKKRKKNHKRVNILCEMTYSYEKFDPLA